RAFMRLYFRIPILIIALVSSLQAAEITLLGGQRWPRDQSPVQAWQVEFRENFWTYASGSLSWINEGHDNGHHRDGLAGQIWARLPLLQDRLSLGVGAGLYRYYDTVPADSHSANVHGLGPIYSLSATWVFSRPWFLRMLLNYTFPGQ